MSLENLINKTKKGMKSLAYSVVIGLALVGNASKVNAVPLGYTITDLKIGGWYCAINDSGQVVAGSFLWQDGKLIDVGVLPNKDYSKVRGINDLGQVVGYSVSTGSYPHPRAFLWENGQMTDIGTLGGPWSYAYNINNASQVIGHSKISDADYCYRGFLWSDSRMIDLTWNCGDTHPYGINDLGQIVGWTSGGAFGGAFLWENGEVRALGASIAWAINNAGQVVGGAKTANGERHAFLWEDGQMKDLGTSPGGHASALGINELGQIVGSGNIIPGSRVGHAFLWEADEMIDLNNLLPPNSGWLLEGASDINYRGQIVGHGTNPDGERHIFLLTPIPEPMRYPIDIKPGSCPNPLNVKSSGVLPIAILGTEDVNVTTIDPTSIRLAGVEPLRSSFEDVATPVSDSNDCNCITEGPDGFLDLTLKFKTQRIVEAVGDVNDGDELQLELIGVLFDETPIEGADCILIRGRHKPINPADINKDGVVNAADFAILAENWLRSSIVEN